MSDVPSFPYELLWGERAVRSVANLTRRDGEEFMAEQDGVINGLIIAHSLIADYREGKS